MIKQTFQIGPKTENDTFWKIVIGLTTFLMFALFYLTIMWEFYTSLKSNNFNEASAQWIIASITIILLSAFVIMLVTLHQIQLDLI